MQRSTKRVNITDRFLEHHIFFLFGAYPFFARTLLQGKSQCKALSGINEKNKQATTTTTATKRWQGAKVH